MNEKTYINEFEFDIYRIVIRQSEAASPRSPEMVVFNVIEKEFDTLGDALEFLHDYYGKDIYTEEHFTVVTIPVHCEYSYWNKDVSHNSKSWWQRDEIYIEKVHETGAYLVAE